MDLKSTYELKMFHISCFKKVFIPLELFHVCHSTLKQIILLSFYLIDQHKVEVLSRYNPGSNLQHSTDHSATTAQ